MEKFSPKKTETETMREAVNHRYIGDDIKDFIVKAGKLYREAKFSEELNFGMIQEAIRSDQALMYFVLLKKAKTYEKVKGASIEILRKCFVKDRRRELKMELENSRQK